MKNIRCSYLVSLKCIKSLLMLKVGRRFVCVSVWFSLLSNLSNFFQRTVHPTDIDVETRNPLLCSSVDNLQPWNAEWKKLSLNLYKVNIVLFSDLATRGPMGTLGPTDIQ